MVLNMLVIVDFATPARFAKCKSSCFLCRKLPEFELWRVSYALYNCMNESYILARDLFLCIV